MSPSARIWSALAVSVLPFTKAATFSHYGTTRAGWTATDSPDGDAVQTFSIALTMQNLDQLESKLLDVSTPGSANYGSHWDDDAVKSYFAPSSEAISSVTAWLEDSGITDYNIDGAFIDFGTTLNTANTLLNASYQYFAKDGTTKLRTLSYSLPDDVQDHIALIDPGLYIGTSRAFVPTPSHTMPKVSPRKLATRTTIEASCQTSITPSCLKELYNVGNYTPKALSGSKIGFGSFLGQAALYSDTFEYERFFGITPQNFSVILIANGTNDQNASNRNYGEADLDVENIIGIAHPLPVTEFITGGSPPFVPNIDQPTAADNQNEPYVPYFRYLLDQPVESLPQVISNSYGDEEDSVPFDYADLTCNLIGLMGLRGITILHSSGDLGVGSGCLAPDNKTVEFNAIFPATCPYVTAVGGTVDVTPEIAWEGSSGGFSSYFARPAYQAAAISEYLKTVSNSTLAYYGQYTNFSGRGFPDIAAHSVNPDYQVIYNGKTAGSGGTSAAAPVWAGLVGLLNDARFRVGKSSLGWLNPLVYQYGPEVLTDITGGYAIGCNGNNTQSGSSEPAGSGIVLGARWNATQGWDPTTGYGTPDFQKLKALVLSL